MVKGSQSIVQEYDTSLHNGSVAAAAAASVHVPCLARIRNDSAHSSISFVGEFCGIDDVKRMVVVSNDNLVRLYRATLNAQASNTMHIPPLTAPADSSSSSLLPSDSSNTILATAASTAALPDSVVTYENVANTSQNNNNVTIARASNNSVTLSNHLTGHENALLSLSSSSSLVSSFGMPNSTFTNVPNSNPNTNPNPNKSNISTRTSYQPSHLTGAPAGSNVTMMTDPPSVSKTNVELYYLRNVLSGVPTYGHRIRGAF